MCNSNDRSSPVEGEVQPLLEFLPADSTRTLTIDVALHAPSTARLSEFRLRETVESFCLDGPVVCLCAK